MFWEKRLRPATDEQIITALAGALTLTAPAGFSEGDRKAWLTAAAITLNGIPPDLLEWGVAHARKVADHPAKIIPAITAEIDERWRDRREARSRELREAAPPERQIEKLEEPMTAEQIEEANLMFKRLGIRTRYFLDGTSRQLEPGEIDPVRPK